jgi:hypothetical protein
MILYGIDNIRDLFGPKVMSYTVIQKIVLGAFYSYSDFSGWFPPHQEQPTMPVGTAPEARGGQLDEDTFSLRRLEKLWLIHMHLTEESAKWRTWNCSENQMCEGLCIAILYGRSFWKMFVLFNSVG